MTIGTQAKKAAGKKVAAKPASATAATKTATKTPAARKAAPAAAAKPHISAEQRRHYVEVAAYYIAERRGFDGASVHDDWVQAEFEIDQLLRAGKLSGG